MIKMIVACDNNNAIGYKGELLCHNKEDMQYFKKMTSDSTVVMGRTTFDSLPFKNGLPNRENLVLTSRIPELSKMGYVGYGNYFECNLAWLSTMLRMDGLSFKSDTWLIGGSSIYNQFKHLAQEVHVTRIDESFENADTYVDLDFLSEYSITSVTRLNDYSVVEVWNLDK